MSEYSKACPMCGGADTHPESQQVGLMPAFVWRDHRVHDLVEALARYSGAGWRHRAKYNRYMREWAAELVALLDEIHAEEEGKE